MERTARWVRGCQDRRRSRLVVLRTHHADDCGGCPLPEAGSRRDGRRHHDAKTVALPPPGHDPTANVVGMPAAAGVEIACGEGAVIAGVQWEQTLVLKTI